MSSARKDLLFLSLEDVIDCGGADVLAAAEDIYRVFRRYAEGQVIQPAKTTLKVASRGHEHGTGLVNFLPAYVNDGDQEIYSCKALGAMPSNVEKGLPRATGLITLFDSVTKMPVAVLDAQSISATRTGAVSLLAARKLANAETEEIGLIGAGVNMRTQLLGISAALPRLKRVRVYARGQSKVQFAREMGERTGLEIVPTDSAREAVTDVKLIVTCLPNVGEPIVMDDWIGREGVTIFNIGCYECEDKILARMDRVIADIWEQGRHRGIQSHAIAVKNGVIPDSKVEDLAPILNGQMAGRKHSTDNIFFCPTGLGIEDAIVAARVYKNALAKNRGTRVVQWNSSKWI